ncbi:MAG TPA: cytochrome P450 [Acidimicrobiales bacterium]|nr:cytochrome P450 [Acidimicrobiales bacterium]
MAPTQTVSVDELAALQLFEACPPGDLSEVAAAVTGTRRVPDGEVVCREGEQADRWWIVADGYADVTVAGLYAATIGPGESIGELALLDGAPRGATVTAVTDLVLHEVDGDAFRSALLDSPRVAVALLTQLAQRLRRANERPARPVVLPDAVPATAPRAPSVDLPSSRQLDPMAPGFLDDPSAQLAALREEAPCHWSDAVHSWVVLRYEDVHRLMRDRALLGSVTTLDPPDVEPRRRGAKMMIRRDGADHLRLRRLVSRVFTPKAIGRWGERAEQIVAGLLDGVADRDQFDVMDEFALVVPAQIISEMLAMPTEDMEQLRAWSHALTPGLDPFVTPAEEAAAEAAGKAMTEYVQQIVTERRGQGGDDIMAALLSAEDAGDVLDDEEVIAQILLLYIAGHETTRNLIGNGLVHLFRFPDQLDRLRADPALDANAIEEVLRYESPAQLTRRLAFADIEVAGVTIPARSHVTLSLASANRDPRKWGPTAEVLDVARPGANEHTSFGGGPHFCLGNALARLEARIALPALIRRFPRLAPIDDAPHWERRMVLRGLAELTVTTR